MFEVCYSRANMVVQCLHEEPIENILFTVICTRGHVTPEISASQADHRIITPAVQVTGTLAVGHMQVIFGGAPRRSRLGRVSSHLHTFLDPILPRALLQV